jgi:hypothetical protein
LSGGKFSVAILPKVLNWPSASLCLRHAHKNHERDHGYGSGDQQ